MNRTNSDYSESVDILFNIYEEHQKGLFGNYLKRTFSSAIKGIPKTELLTTIDFESDKSSSICGKIKEEMQIFSITEERLNYLIDQKKHFKKKLEDQIHLQKRYEKEKNQWIEKWKQTQLDAFSIEGICNKYFEAFKTDSTSAYNLILNEIREGLDSKLDSQKILASLKEQEDAYFYSMRTFKRDLILSYTNGFRFDFSHAEENAVTMKSALTFIEAEIIILKKGLKQKTDIMPNKIIWHPQGKTTDISIRELLYVISRLDEIGYLKLSEQEIKDTISEHFKSKKKGDLRDFLESTTDQTFRTLKHVLSRGMMNAPKKLRGQGKVKKELIDVNDVPGLILATVDKELHTSFLNLCIYLDKDIDEAVSEAIREWVAQVSANNQLSP